MSDDPVVCTSLVCRCREDIARAIQVSPEAVHAMWTHPGNPLLDRTFPFDRADVVEFREWFASAYVEAIGQNIRPTRHTAENVVALAGTPDVVCPHREDQAQAVAESQGVVPEACHTADPEFDEASNVRKTPFPVGAAAQRPDKAITFPPTPHDRLRDEPAEVGRPGCVVKDNTFANAGPDEKPDASANTPDQAVTFLHDPPSDSDNLGIRCAMAGTPNPRMFRTRAVRYAAAINRCFEATRTADLAALEVRSAQHSLSEAKQELGSAMSSNSETAWLSEDRLIIAIKTTEPATTLPGVTGAVGSPSPTPPAEVLRVDVVPGPPRIDVAEPPQETSKCS